MATTRSCSGAPCAARTAACASAPSTTIWDAVPSSRAPPGVSVMPAWLRVISWSPRSWRRAVIACDTADSLTPSALAAARTDPSRATRTNAFSCVRVIAHSSVGRVARPLVHQRTVTPPFLGAASQDASQASCRASPALYRAAGAAGVRHAPPPRRYHRRVSDELFVPETSRSLRAHSRGIPAGAARPAHNESDYAAWTASIDTSGRHRDSSGAACRTRCPWMTTSAT